MSKNSYDNNLSTTDNYHGRSRNKELNPIPLISNIGKTRSSHRDAISISADRKPSKSNSAQYAGDYKPGYGWRKPHFLIPQDIDADAELETSNTENEYGKSITGRNRSREYRSSPRSRERSRSTSKSSTNGDNTDVSSRSKRAIPYYNKGSDPRIRSDRKSRPSSRVSATSRGVKSSYSITGDYHSSNSASNRVPPLDSNFTDNESTDNPSRTRIKKKESRSVQSDDSKKSHKSTTNNSTKSRSSVEQTFKEAVRVKLSRPAFDDVKPVPIKRGVVIDHGRAYRAEMEQEVILDADTDWGGPGADELRKEHSSSSSSQLQNNRSQNPPNTVYTSTSTTTAEYNHPNSSIRRKRVGGPEDPTFMPTRKPVPKPVPRAKDLQNLSSREASRISSRSDILEIKVKLGYSRDRDRDRDPSGTEGWGNGGNPFDGYGRSGKEEKGREKEKEREKKNRLKNMKMSEKLGRALRGFGRRSKGEGEGGYV
ncbi:hypothetical protein sscle_09g070570 [Sclerotinia sclerotiorum 1980 UF-70]|uniref:Uncharacterized protein n=1 Tax=Sclerotinia sclerotiorum (strain ATCC 18683 / 1980 / Ss-1) TaxID=665079 RepID=A0A1D9QBH6_SCLS1|nr:hypothetical protein sscle_09g070570 [Sclerotinia sclerotiorum 1980 UF-70]